MVDGPFRGMRMEVRSKRVRGKHVDKDVEKCLNAGMRRRYLFITRILMYCFITD